MPLTRLNLIKNFRGAVDREAAATLLLLLSATVAALVVLPIVLSGSAADIRDAVLKGAGALLLLLGSYYGARTLKENRTDKRTDQMLKAIELLAADDSAIRAGAVATLQALRDSASGAQEEWQKQVITEILPGLPVHPTSQESRSAPATLDDDEGPRQL